MLGIRCKDANDMDRGCRPSLNSNCSHYRQRTASGATVRSFHYHNRLGAHRPSSESLALYRTRPACLPIVSGPAVLAAGTAATTTGDGRRDMWMIKEVSSASETVGERHISVFPDGPQHGHEDTAPVASVSDSSNSSGNLNSGYVDELIDDLDEEIGEDDVFYADASTFSANDLESDTSEILRRNETGDTAAGTNKKNSKMWCLSSSSPQQARSVYVVDSGTPTAAPSTTCYERKRPNQSASTDLSPAKTLKLSPVRAVGEFLLHHNSNKCAKLVLRDNK